MQKINDAAIKTAGAAMKPVLEFNNFFVKSSETTFSKQVECYNAYIKLGMDNVNESFNIRTYEDMIDFTNKQKGVVEKTADMFLSNTKMFAELNTKFTEEARSLIETNIKTSVTAVNEAVKSVT